MLQTQIRGSPTCPSVLEVSLAPVAVLSGSVAASQIDSTQLLHSHCASATYILARSAAQTHSFHLAIATCRHDTGQIYMIAVYVVTRHGTLRNSANARGIHLAVGASEAISRMH